MHILQISYTDILGRRFNGYDLCLRHSALGHEARQVVWRKDAPGNVSWSLRSPGLWAVTMMARVAEYATGLQSVLLPAPAKLFRAEPFTQADIVHCQIIHLNFFSLLALPELTRKKPTVWTFHDMWPLTGHCIHAFDCQGWLSGCTRCPNLSTPLPMSLQGAERMFQLKRRLYARADFDVIVLSDWLGERVERSPLLRGHTVHHVPPGLDITAFAPGNKAAARRRFGVPEQATVVAFRQSGSPFKGLPAVLEALSGLEPHGDIHLLTCGETGRIAPLRARFPCTELGELAETAALVDFYRAADMFLMPSKAESFGMMAAEACSCGVPCVVFNGAALPRTCFADEGGSIAVPQNDARALAEAVRALADAPQLRRRLGARARELAASRYDFNRHADAVLRVYEAVVARRGDVASPQT